jgi:hypothetical protein
VEDGRVRISLSFSHSEASALRWKPGSAHHGWGLRATPGADARSAQPHGENHSRPPYPAR